MEPRRQSICAYTLPAADARNEQEIEFLTQ